MRTNIEIDDRLMAEAIKLMDVKTKREAVEKALREAVRHRNAAKAVAALRGKIQWDGDLDAMRRGDAPDLDD